MRLKATKTTNQRSAKPADFDLGRRVRLRRVELGMSQAELGHELGIAFQQVQRYEKGATRISAIRLQRIAAALKTDVSFFYKGNKTTREVDSLLFLDSSFSLRLLRVYSSIKSEAVRRQFVALMESIVANH